MPVQCDYPLVVVVGRGLAVDLADVVADEVLLVEHGVVRAQEVVAGAEQAVVVHLMGREKKK